MDQSLEKSSKNKEENERRTNRFDPIENSEQGKRKKRTRGGE